MAKKTWKLGEWAKGGVITSEVKAGNILIIGKDWDRSQGDKRGSSQANAKEFTRMQVPVADINAGSLWIFLNDLTSVGYTDQIMAWVENQIKSKGL
jgi:hypothetical protein